MRRKSAGRGEKGLATILPTAQGPSQWEQEEDSTVEKVPGGHKVQFSALVDPVRLE